MNKTSNTFWVISAVFWMTSILTTAALYFFVLQPQQIRLAQSRQEIIQSQQQMQQAQLASLSSAKDRQQEQINEILRQKNRFMVTADLRDQLQFEISEIANQLQLREYSGKLSIDPWGSQEDRISRIWMEIKFESSFVQYSKFITELERHEPVIFVESASIQKNSNQDHIHRASLVICFLIESDEEFVTAVTAKGGSV